MFHSVFKKMYRIILSLKNDFKIVFEGTYDNGKKLCGLSTAKVVFSLSQKDFLYFQIVCRGTYQGPMDDNGLAVLTRCSNFYIPF